MRVSVFALNTELTVAALIVGHRQTVCGFGDLLHKGSFQKPPFPLLTCHSKSDYFCISTEKP